MGHSNDFQQIFLEYLASLFDWCCWPLQTWILRHEVDLWEAWRPTLSFAFRICGRENFTELVWDLVASLCELSSCSWAELTWKSYPNEMLVILSRSDPVSLSDLSFALLACLCYRIWVGFIASSHQIQTIAWMLVIQSYQTSQSCISVSIVSASLHAANL